jgi:hypothetical protein
LPKKTAIKDTSSPYSNKKRLIKPFDYKNLQTKSTEKFYPPKKPQSSGKTALTCPMPIGDNLCGKILSILRSPPLVRQRRKG